ncbi:hypothetical protein NRB20_75450 [Nocardia sp. RB20]|uniref:Uncharacterized protein n=1 Tax=Nocardia macrotermitis TaxID=2585198 RepID=A0A7K0DF43_9NOCA|nr:hypothetical protein [Nocardia macrotermitis]
MELVSDSSSMSMSKTEEVSESESESSGVSALWKRWRDREFSVLLSDRALGTGISSGSSGGRTLVYRPAFSSSFPAVVRPSPTLSTRCVDSDSVQGRQLTSTLCRVRNWNSTPSLLRSQARRSSLKAAVLL